MVIYFSGTGNSKYIAERIVGSLQENRRESGSSGTDLCMEDPACGF